MRGICCRPEVTQNIEPRFDANASLEDGVSGKLRIDTKYENNLPPENIIPRTKDPMPKAPVNDPEDYVHEY